MPRFLLFLFTGFLLISCGYYKEKHDNQQVFNMLLPSGLSSLDPAYARDQANSWMISQLFNGLVQLDSNLVVQPCIAQSWEIKDSGKVYIFHLRRDVVFHPHPAFSNVEDRFVRAKDFVYSFNRIADPKTGSFGQWIFNGKVEGSGTEEPFQDLPGFRAMDDSTLVIRLKHPFPAFLSLLSMPYASVVSQTVIEKIGKAHRSHPVGTGPFLFKSWREGESLILLKNPEYFERDGNARLPFLEAVRVGFSPGPLTAFHKLVKGEVDFLNRPDLSLKDELFEADGSLKAEWTPQFYLIRKPQLNTEYLGIQMDTSERSHPLSNLYLRKAIAFAIDRDKLVKTVLKGMGYPAHGGFIPPGMPLSDTALVKGYRYHPDSANWYLKQAGYPGGRGLPELTLLTSPSYQSVMEMLQYQLSEIGIRLQLDNGDGSSLREMIYQGKVPFWRASWIADYPDAENYLSLFYSGNRAPSGPNTTRYLRPEFDSLFMASLSMAEDSIREKYHLTLQNQLNADVPVILLYYDRIIRLVRKEVHGLEIDAMNNLVLKRVKKRQK